MVEKLTCGTFQGNLLDKLLLNHLTIFNLLISFKYILKNTEINTHDKKEISIQHKNY